MPYVFILFVCVCVCLPQFSWTRDIMGSEFAKQNMQSAYPSSCLAIDVLFKQLSEICLLSKTCARVECATWQQWMSRNGTAMGATDPHTDPSTYLFPSLSHTI